MKDAQIVKFITASWKIGQCHERRLLLPYLLFNNFTQEGGNILDQSHLLYGDVKMFEEHLSERRQSLRLV